jgi:hypothetical protein
VNLLKEHNKIVSDYPQKLKSQFKPCFLSGKINFISSSVGRQHIACIENWKENIQNILMFNPKQLLANI